MGNEISSNKPKTGVIKYEPKKKEVNQQYLHIETPIAKRSIRGRFNFDEDDEMENENENETNSPIKSRINKTSRTPSYLHSNSPINQPEKSSSSRLYIERERTPITKKQKLRFLGKITPKLFISQQYDDEENELQQESSQSNSLCRSPSVEMVSNYIHLPNYTFLYDSQKDNFDNRTFNSTISCHSNVLIIIITTDYDIFGVYQKQRIPLLRPNTTMVLELSEEFFVFCYNDVMKEIIKKSTDTKITLTLYSQVNTTLLLTVFSAFWIETNGKINFNKNLKVNYSYLPSINPFVKEQTTRSCSVKYLFAVECV